MAARTLRLGAFMRPVSIHTGAWRYPGAYPDANFNFSHLKRFAQRLEQARFDAFFMADHLAVLNMPLNALMRSHTVTSFEPFTLLSALAGATERIGLVATASTTFDQPCHVARRFASLDHLSGGRAGWNIVTTSNPDAALNFGLTEHVEHDERYRRAREFYDVVTGLWDSFADDAFVRDVEAGISSLSVVLGCDASRFDPDAPLPEIPPTNAGQSGRERAIELARREGLTVRQLAQRLGGFGGLAFVGTPRTIADQMEEWLVQNGCDGFNIMFPYLPGGLDDFVDRVVPELQRRGLFRREYEGSTLRENLGLARPANRFFPERAAPR
ncbi:LLM class flavin-dependent oxidoreductase [Sorangium sp. So ce542]|uniref:LLM class flavin-dependent oxidoreductase n=1 Tax=Sorangium sp. So ce542 TaxID=3133316 RepID=UPI003F6132AC